MDAATGYGRVYACSGQSEKHATECLALFVAELRSLMKSSGFLSPHVLRSDGGAAFVAHNFREFCAREQIRLSLSAPYTPSQNSFVERMWGTRFATARVLLAASSLSLRFHVQAVYTANWLHNRLPSASRGGKSPFELLSGRVPDLTHLRAFGCAVAVFRQPDVRTKEKGHKKLVADRADLGVYLGPSEDYPAHVTYLSKRGFTVSAHCDFDERVFPGVKSVASTDWVKLLAQGPLGTYADTLVEQPARAGPVQPTAAPATPSHVAPVARDRADTTADASSRELRLLAGTGNDGVHGQPAAPTLGRDGRAKRDTAARRRQSAITRAYVAVVGGKSPTQLTAKAASWMSPTTALAYECNVGVFAAALPHPDLRIEDVRIPRGYQSAMKDQFSDYWMEAVHREWTGIMANDTLDFVRRKDIPSTANVMHCHYVFDGKPTKSGALEKFKARLVADGNTQKQGQDFEAVFATVVKLASVRVVLSIAAARGWSLWQYDIKQAFLQSNVDEDLYMRMPPNLTDRDANGDLLVCKLKKSLYGLKQAAREWSDTLNATLLGFGFRRSIIDTCVYRYDGDGGRVLLLLVYVDDLVCSYSHDDVLAAFARHISAALPVDDRGPLEWVLRMHVSRPDGATVIVSQQQYAERMLQKYVVDTDTLVANATPLDDTPLTHDMCPAVGSEEHSAMAAKRAWYMSVIGALLWMAGGTRPDLTYAVSTLARFCSNPGRAHVKALMHLLGYVSRTRARVLMLRPVPSREVEIYSDASWSAKHSTSGGLVLFWGCLVAWWSRLQKSVSASTAEAEYFSAALAAREGVYVRDLIDDLGFGVTAPTPLYLDNKATIELTQDPVAFKKTKHILRHAYELRDRVAHRVLRPAFVPTHEQLADVLTKSLSADLHARMLPQLLHAAIPA